ncbi:MAG: hypothetical protein Q9221_009115, partial [Calogaya cf. arnoldii]
ERSATGTLRTGEGNPRPATSAPREEDTSRPVTPEDGYRHRLTPEHLTVMMASGQSSTDSLGACGRPAGLRWLTSSPRRAAEPPDRQARGKRHAVLDAGADG